MRLLPIVSVCVLAVVFILPAFAGQEIIEREVIQQTTVISIGRHGTISVAHQRVRQKDLLATLAKLGVTSGSKIAVEGEQGAKYKDISSVMETLAAAGLLPQATID